ncbi:SCO family protein [Pontibacter rugosus]|uniref:SCO family protein n=1 Tax=Pontibacter rugosus TaxID=1745966 RepID=A0ABW3SVG4_9BACT
MTNRNKLSLKRILTSAALALAALVFYGCDSSSSEKTLPIFGERETVERTVNGEVVTDTIYHQIPDFAFVNQDSQRVTQEAVQGKIYVTDFFFTTCPSICPKMKSQMLRIYEAYKDNPQVLLLSHSIDPQHDTVAVLRDYADRLGIETNKWHLLTGEKDSIYDIATKYLVAAQEDEGVAGGFAHGGNFILVDGERHIRGNYDGTVQEDVDKLIEDIEVLLNEKKHEKK